MSNKKYSAQEIKDFLINSGIEPEVMLSPEARKRGSRGIIKREGRPVIDAKAKYSGTKKELDYIVYITKSDAERFLKSDWVPRALKKVIVYNLDILDSHEDPFVGRCIPLNISELMRRELFSNKVNELIIGNDKDAE